MKYSLAIFDMDGTILNTLEDLKDSLNFALTQNGLPTRTLEETRRFVGNGIRRLVELGVPENSSKGTTEKVFECFNEHYAVHCNDKTRAYDGITELIKRLDSLGIKTAVVSNKSDYAVQTLCKDYFDGLFGFALGLKDSIRKKPYPDSVNLVLEKFNIKKENAVYIGDSEVDIMTAGNAGIDCISVDWGFRTDEELVNAGARKIVKNMKELEKEITKQ